MNIKHTVLYAKGWYKRSDLTQDLIKTLSADGYVPSYKIDIIHILINNIFPTDKSLSTSTPLYTAEDIKDFMLNLLSDIDPTNIWRVGGNRDQYDYQEAIIYALLSKIKIMSVEACGLVKDKEPDYTILPKWE